LDTVTHEKNGDNSDYTLFFNDDGLANKFFRGLRSFSPLDIEVIGETAFVETLIIQFIFGKTDHGLLLL
jgi:hypothetical protein